MSAAVVENTGTDDTLVWAAAMIDGACRAWALPPEVFARTARERVELVAIALGLDDDRVFEVGLCAGELAANALIHGGRGGPGARWPEVWLHIRQTEQCRELVVTIFDDGAGPAHFPISAAGEESESGRGFPIVHELSRGHWGLHPSRSRLARREVPGTAAWFAVALPDSLLTSPRPRPVPSAVAAVGLLAAHLTTRHVGDLITRVYGEVALLSCPDGLTVWAIRGAYRWTTAAGPRERPFRELVDVAEDVIAEVERRLRRKEQEIR